MHVSSPTALQRAIDKAGGVTALARKLTERGREVKDHRVINQWRHARVPAEYCPDIEALTGVRCEELRPDIAWDVLRAANDHQIVTPTYIGPDRRKKA